MEKIFTDAIKEFNHIFENAQNSLPKIEDNRPKTSVSTEKRKHSLNKNKTENDLKKTKSISNDSLKFNLEDDENMIKESMDKIRGIVEQGKNKREKILKGYNECYQECESIFNNIQNNLDDIITKNGQQEIIDALNSLLTTKKSENIDLNDFFTIDDAKKVLYINPLVPIEDSTQIIPKKKYAHVKPVNNLKKYEEYSDTQIISIHEAQTKIKEKAEILIVKPETVNFTDYVPNETYVRKLNVKNGSKDILKFRIKVPQANVVKIVCENANLNNDINLAPGLSLDLNIYFKPVNCFKNEYDIKCQLSSGKEYIVPLITQNMDPELIYEGQSLSNRLISIGGSLVDHTKRVQIKLKNIQGNSKFQIFPDHINLDSFDSSTLNFAADSKLNALFHETIIVHPEKFELEKDKEIAICVDIKPEQEGAIKHSFSVISDTLKIFHFSLEGMAEYKRFCFENSSSILVKDMKDVFVNETRQFEFSVINQNSFAIQTYWEIKEKDVSTIPQQCHSVFSVSPSNVEFPPNGKITFVAKYSPTSPRFHEFSCTLFIKSFLSQLSKVPVNEDTHLELIVRGSCVSNKNREITYQHTCGPLNTQFLIKDSGECFLYQKKVSNHISLEFSNHLLDLSLIKPFSKHIEQVKIRNSGNILIKAKISHQMQVDESLNILDPFDFRHYDLATIDCFPRVLLPNAFVLYEKDEISLQPGEEINISVTVIPIMECRLRCFLRFNVLNEEPCSLLPRLANKIYITEIRAECLNELIEFTKSESTISNCFVNYTSKDKIVLRNCRMYKTFYHLRSKNDEKITNVQIPQFNGWLQPGECKEIEVLTKPLKSDVDVDYNIECEYGGKKEKTFVLMKGHSLGFSCNVSSEDPIDRIIYPRTDFTDHDASHVLFFSPLKIGESQTIVVNVENLSILSSAVKTKVLRDQFLNVSIKHEKCIESYGILPIEVKVHSLTPGLYLSSIICDFEGYSIKILFQVSFNGSPIQFIKSLTPGLGLVEDEEIAHHLIVGTLIQEMEGQLINKKKNIAIQNTSAIAVHVSMNLEQQENNYSLSDLAIDLKPNETKSLSLFFQGNHIGLYECAIGTIVTSLHENDIERDKFIRPFTLLPRALIKMSTENIKEASNLLKFIE